VLFDTWVHPLMMGLEEHLLTMFRSDFEFHDGQAPSHLGLAAAAEKAARPVVADPAVSGQTQSPAAADESASTAARPADSPAPASASDPIAVGWTAEAERELRKIPFFVRGKARRNTERFASERGVATITVETLYDAKAHFAR
jgi:light-independent protochlorophyllide reductase subunit B